MIMDCLMWVGEGEMPVIIPDQCKNETDELP